MNDKSYKIRETRFEDVRHCARCGEDHGGMKFLKFSQHPIEDSDGTIWNWWGLCPVTDEPVLLKEEKK